MERIRRRFRNRTEPGERWQAPLANALQQAQIVYLAGSLFVGIAYQPFIYMLIGLQCGPWSYLKRTARPDQPVAVRPRGPAGLRVTPA